MPVRDSLSGLEITDRPTAGVNLVGFLDAEFGLGEAARLVGRTLEHAGVPVSHLNYTQTPVRREHVVERAFSDAVPFDVNVICLQPDALPAFAEQVGPQLFADRLSIGLWFWDSTVLPPEFRSAFDFLDRIWVLSEFAQQAIAPAGDIPVRVIPVAVEERTAPHHPRSELELPDGFVFLALFDFVSFERKNPLGIAEAFDRAFDPAEHASLVLKGINGRERKPQHLSLLRAAAEARDDITIVDGHVSAEGRDALLAECDCLVSLHRAEGFGLPMLEAILFGTPVIATAYSGNTQFMDEESSYLVPYDLVPVPSDVWGWTPGAMWAEPRVEVAARLMRQAYDDHVEARARGIEARRRLLLRYSPEIAAGIMAAELDDAREEWAKHGDARRIEREGAFDALRARSSPRAHGLIGSVRRRIGRRLPGARPG